MYSLMHIGDLHRSATEPISNVEIVSALAADRDSYVNEKTPVPCPDAIVVSGDLVQGLPLDSSEYPSALIAQYKEAADLVARLTEEFLDGDRSRLIMVPGNHDVDWNKAKTAMQPAEVKDDDILRLLTRPRSDYRWSWKTRALFHIVNHTQYRDRFRYFEDFYREFYEGSQLWMPLDPDRSWNLFPLRNGELVVCGFNSCGMNDCFNLSGEILPEAISESHLEMRKRASKSRLGIAVWHHGTQGPPQRNDYMDADTLALLLAKGYRLGMHGHQHRFEALPYTLYVSECEMMAVTCTGSLCASHSELPAGSNRSYSIVHIDESEHRARVHVREMVCSGVFGPARLLKAGGRTYFDVQWTQANQNRLVNTGVEGGTPVSILENVEQAIAAEDYQTALERAKRNRVFLAGNARPLLLEVLFRAKEWPDLLREIGVPRNPDELMKAFAACVATKDWSRAERSVNEAVEKQIIVPSLGAQLIGRLRAERGSTQ